MQHRRTVSIVLPFLLLLITPLACTIPPEGGQSGTTPSPTDLQFDVRQQAKLVWAGSEDPLPELSSLEFQPLAEGDRVSTDWQGEALLQANLPTGVCQVYLFQESSLVKRACSRAEAGNSSCLEEGSAVYNNCSNHIVMTPSAEAILLGTWVSVTYLPDQQTTIFIVAEGEIEVRPVTDLFSFRLSEPVRVVGQQFLVTAPDTHLHPIAGLSPREPLGWDELPPVIDELELQPWIERTGRHADLDTVPAPPMGEDASRPSEVLQPNDSDSPAEKEAELGTFVLMPVGKPFDDIRMQEALWYLTGPEDLVNDILDQPDMAVLAVDSDGYPEVDMAMYPHDPKIGLKLLREAGYIDNFTIMIVTAREDELAVKLVELMQARLQEAGVKVALSYVSAGEVDMLIKASSAAGRPALGVYRR